MTNQELTKLIDSLIHETISETEHEQLQIHLKADAEARSIFRERMDLESALRTWASESPMRDAAIIPAAIWKRRFFWGAVLAMVAVFMIVPWIWITWSDSENENPRLAETPQPAPRSQELPNSSLGWIREQPGTQWEKRPSQNERIAKGDYILSQGVAEFRFDSGTDLILEAPCQLTVASWDSAQLLGGNVFVNVTELSSGFTLETLQGQILDEGTQYAVSLEVDATEIHVFDGSVIWVPETSIETKTEERIEAGEAKRFANADPSKAHHIPFGQRQFVHRLEADLKEQAGDALLAYDGFENLAGQIRRNRSGFGWSRGWEPVTRRGNRGKLATIVDAPDDVVFGISRKGRRLLSLESGDDLQRAFENPLAMQSDETIFLSFFIERLPAQDHSRRYLQMSLEPNRPRRGHRQPSIVSVGVTSEGFPFLRVGHAISKTAAPINDHEICLCVVKVTQNQQAVQAQMRVYHEGENPNFMETDIWTVTGMGPAMETSADTIRLTVGSQGHWHVDELRIGRTWASVVSKPKSD